MPDLDTCLKAASGPIHGSFALDEEAAALRSADAASGRHCMVCQQLKRLASRQAASCDIALQLALKGEGGG